MTIGPQENSPAVAFDVRARKYPPGALISAKRSSMATTTIDACSGPMQRCASSQAEALIPIAGRTWQAASKRATRHPARRQHAVHVPLRRREGSRTVGLNDGLVLQRVGGSNVLRVGVVKKLNAEKQGNIPGVILRR